MKIKNQVIIVAVLIIIFSVAIYFYFSKINFFREDISDTNIQLNYNFYQISKIKEIKSVAGIFITEGYVVKKYTCPPCPDDGKCKPCMRNNIIISENNKPIDSYSLTNKELIIFVDNPDKFIIGQKYRFSVKFLDNRSTSEEINDLELVQSDSL